MRSIVQGACTGDGVCQGGFVAVWIACPSRLTNVYCGQPRELWSSRLASGISSFDHVSNSPMSYSDNTPLSSNIINPPQPERLPTLRATTDTPLRPTSSTLRLRWATHTSVLSLP